MLLLSVGMFAAGIGSVSAWHWFDGKYWNPDTTSPIMVVHTRARVWVPAAKYGHVTVVPVRVLVPRS